MPLRTWCDFMALPFGQRAEMMIPWSMMSLSLRWQEQLNSPLSVQIQVTPMLSTGLRCLSPNADIAGGHDLMTLRAH